MSTSAQERQRGFTLVEIMVVVVIIGLLAALVGPEIWRMLGFGQTSIAQTKCKTLHDKAMMWKMINRKPPDSIEEMVAPLKDGDDENFLDSVLILQQPSLAWLLISPIQLWTPTFAES